MKRTLILALIALVAIGLFVANGLLLRAGAAPAANETMRAAGRLYEAGRFGPAALAYQQLVDQGLVDPALFYNLGNAYFQQGDYGRAILNYRRAQQLAPRDADIAANLALARARTVDRFETGEKAGLLVQVDGAVRQRLTLDELAMVALGAWIGFILVLLLFGSARAGSAWRRGLQYILLAAAIVLVVGLLALGNSLYLAGSRATGVIVADQVDITSGPGAQYATGFDLHSGAEVILVEARGGWARLAVPGSELEGWAPAGAVEAVAG